MLDILNGKVDDKLNGAEAKIDSIVDKKRPVAVAYLLI
jgi:hypothetical protein